jgi:alkaline phosphatase D
MVSSLVSLISYAAVASASWTSNLNYRSPSEHHPGLGIALHKVNKRNTPAKFSASQLNFTHGVASGDPYSDSVILWTRISPQYADVNDNSSVSGTVPLYSHGPNLTVSTAPVCVDYQVSESEDFSDVCSKGRAYTSSDVDYTVKVEAKGLQPFTRYYYQFTVCDSDKKSVLGRTKTAPAVDDHVANVGLAVYSCSNYPFGFFNAYGNPARKDSVDYVIHLGDYIYEYAGDGDYGYGYSIGRIPKPEAIIFTLDDYRERLATYRSDLDLQLSHATFPWIPVWDDHEVSHLESMVLGKSEANHRCRSLTTHTAMALLSSTTPRLLLCKTAVCPLTSAR